MKTMKKMISVLLVGFLLVGMCACGGEKPEQAVANMLDAVKNMDQEAAAKYIDYDKLINAGEEAEAVTDDSATEEQVSALLSKLSYEIVSTSQDGNTATVETKITNIDMQVVMGDLVQQAFGLIFSGLSEEEMDAKIGELFNELISAEDVHMVTKTVAIQLEKKDGQWKIDTSEELMDGILGGMVTIAKNLEGSFGDDSSPEE